MFSSSVSLGSVHGPPLRSSSSGSLTATAVPLLRSQAGKTLSLRRLRPERWFSEGRAVFGKVISKQIYSSAEEEWN